MLQEHVHYYQNQVNGLKRENEEVEQYGKSLCVRVDGIPSLENETSDEVLDKVKSLMQEAECDIPQVVIDRAHGIGKGSVEKKTRTKGVFLSCFLSSGKCLVFFLPFCFQYYSYLPLSSNFDAMQSNQKFRIELFSYKQFPQSCA